MWASAQTKSPGPLASKDPFSKFDRIIGEPKEATVPPAAPVAVVPKPAEVPEGPVKPTLPRPPVWICALTTQIVPPIRRAVSTASAAV